MSRRISRYGSWKSPITSDMVASRRAKLGQVEIEKENTYWHEMRPSETGRCVVVKHSADGETVDVNPSPFNARTRFTSMVAETTRLDRSKFRQGSIEV